VQEQGALRVGEIIGGRYRLIAPLGEGGFGVAYRAWDNTAGIPVVLKMPLAKHLVRPAIVERFAREVTRLRESNHPHIVPIVDDGVDQQGRPYLVMRFLPGGSLSHRRKPAGASALHRWLPAIASALDYTHSLGVLHRDVKPSNIFFDTRALAYLGDFGIAKLVEDDDDMIRTSPVPLLDSRDVEESLTRTGSLIGTAVYMAPEAFDHTSKLTRQADQYSLAVSVYQLLSGQLPFVGTVDVLRAQHQMRQPPPLETRIKGLPPSLCVAIARGLSKKPAARYPNCEEFAAAILADVPLTPVDPSHHRFLCPACQRLVRVPENFGGRACRCPDCHARLKVSPNSDALWTAREAGVVSLAKPAVRIDKIVAQVLFDTEAAPAKPPAPSGREMPAIDKQVRLLLDEGRYDEAEPIAKLAVENASKEHIDRSFHNLGCVYLHLGRHDDAHHFLSRARAVMNASGRANHPDMASTLNVLGMVHTAQDDYGEAEVAYKEALAIGEITWGWHDPSTAAILTKLALLYMRQRRLEDAEPLLRRALAIRERALGLEHLDTAAAVDDIALCYVLQRHDAKALPLRKRALAIREKALGPDHPDTAASLTALASLIFSEGEYAQAEPLCKRALFIRERALGQSHPDTATSLYLLGSVYFRLGEHSKAEPLLKQALAIREKAFGLDHPDTKVCRNRLAALQDFQGDRE
jgi:serine/threonine protein kinase/tetratricopeptide (TPR) repeat protein